MLTEVCQYLRNWFNPTVYLGTFTVENGNIRLQYSDGASFVSLPLKDGQYFRIINSDMNNGVWRYPCYELTDEEFSGAVWLMRVPKHFVALVNEIEAWQEKYGGADAASMSPFTSENLSSSGYSYTLKDGGSGGAGGGVTWKTVFAARLDAWRKI